ncbi:MAG: hypothetical protein A2068_09520 [Ignavibacteria bacterium GWB2_35_6b]|nr:MAG: hypothetical protein A2068_09520 [Ignavibacteria bacterium GWB2_35_6b]
MKSYEYQILRYCHDRISGEFVNIGILLFAHSERLLFIKTVDKFHRLSEFFPSSNGRHVKKIIDRLEQTTNKLKKRVDQQFDLDKFTAIEVIANKILPKDDSAFYFSETLKGLTLDYEHILESLFNDIVLRHEKVIEKKSLSDDEVWRNVYKKYFDKKNITEKLIPHYVSTKNDEFEFEYCWKNDIWHIYKPISFELTDHNKIKSKIYQHNGLLNELLTSKEPLSISYLTTKPKLHDHPELLTLIKEKLLYKNSNIKTDIVFEEEAELFTDQLKLEIDSHQ